MKDTGTLGEPYNSASYPTGINNADEVVGESVTSDSFEHPFLYSDGVMRDLNSLIPKDSGWELINVSDINDNGYIVGNGINSDGREHAFLLIPFPMVDSTVPVSGARGVERDTNITVTFSDGMDEASLGTSIKLKQWNAKKKRWKPVPVGVLSVDGNTVTLDPYPTEPSRLLAANKRYKVTVTTGATNLAGIPMLSPKSWTFTTGST